MAAAVMTRHSKVHKTRSAPIPPRLELNGAASRESLHINSAMANNSEDYSNRDRSCSSSSSNSSNGGGGERRRRDREPGGGTSRRGGRERSSRLVVDGVLVYSELSPETQESISQVFKFDTKAAEFEDNMNQVWPHRCTFVVKELIETERAYVKALGEIIKVMTR